MFEHEIDDRLQLAHAGYQGDLLGWARCKQSSAEHTEKEKMSGSIVGLRGSEGGL